MALAISEDFLRRRCQVPLADLTPYRASELVLDMGPLAAWWLQPEVLARAARECLTLQNYRRRPGPLSSGPGSCWIVLVRTENLPLLRPAFLLPLRWTEGQHHSPSLPGSLAELADAVVDALLDEEEVKGRRWGLQLGDALDGLDLSEIGEGFDFSSGWASLAGGLLMKAVGGKPDPKVWATAAWDPKRGICEVAGLGAKLSLALEWKAREFFVSQQQVEEVRQLAASHGSAIEIGILSQSELKARKALTRYLNRLEIPPVYDDAGDFGACRDYYMRQDLGDESERIRLFDYYVHNLLRHIASACHEKIRPRLKGKACSHLVTIVSQNPEVTVLGLLEIGATYCLLLHTTDQKQCQLAGKVKEVLERHDVYCRLAPFEKGEPMATQMESAVADFVQGVPAASVAFDMTPGDKKMTLTLALEVARSGNWLLYTAHEFKKNRPVPGTEEPNLWRR